MSEWMAALGLALVLEGLMPLLFPQQWRAFVQAIAQLTAGQIRFVGLSAILAGVVVLLLAR
jgi:uncharacterized protein